LGKHGHRGTGRLIPPGVTAFGIISISIGGLIWHLYPETGAWPVVFLLVPAAVLFLRRPAWKPTPFDVPMAVFLLTAGVSVWSAYDRAAAMGKFWLLLAAALLYFGLTRLRLEDFWAITGVMAGWSVVIAAHFLLTHDWTIQPADLGVLTDLGLRWMDVRPALNFRPLHPNIAGGLLATLLPLQIAAAWYAGRRKRRRLLLAFLAAAGFSFTTLILTSSRAAWLALGLAAALWFLWHGTRFLEKQYRIPRRSLFIGALLVAGLLVLMVVLASPGRLLVLLDRLPGPSSARSRLALFREAIQLVGDYPVIGGGLSAFPALYSEYVLVTPHFFLGYAHNLFLDVVLEQGVLALLAVVIILGGSLIRLSFRLWTSTSPSQRMQSLRWAALAGLLVLLVHSMLDDPFYGMEGTPLLFAMPGLAISATPSRKKSRRKVAADTDLRPANRRPGALLSSVVIISFLGSLVLVRQPLRAILNANLGAVEMAQVRLADWPTGVWDEGGDLDALGPARSRFERAIEANPYQPTALYRLGILEMLERDYLAASQHLELARRVSPEHRGVQKTLGYTLAWLGEYEEAAPLLAPLPEVAQELEVYQWWWEDQGRPDLSAHAMGMAAYLQPEAASPTGP
jgi:O-antigen ligase